MWPDVPNLAIAQLTFLAEVNGQRIMNTFGYIVDGVTTPQPLDAVANAFFGDLVYIDLETDWLDCVAEDVQLKQAWFQVLAPERLRKVVLTRNLDGTIESTTNRQNTQAAISRHTPFAGRAENGGIHIVLPDNNPLGLQVATDGLLTQAYKDILTELAGSMLVAVETVVGGSPYNWQPCIIQAAPGVTPPIQAGEIVATIVQDEARTMRRRTVRQGI